MLLWRDDAIFKGKLWPDSHSEGYDTYDLRIVFHFSLNFPCQPSSLQLVLHHSSRSLRRSSSCTQPFHVIISRRQNENGIDQKSESDYALIEFTKNIEIRAEVTDSGYFLRVGSIYQRRESRADVSRRIYNWISAQDGGEDYDIWEE